MSTSNTKIIILTLFFKSENFRVLQFYPLKMNLVLEIRKWSPQRVVDTPPLDPLFFPK